ncbi:MAG TPA: 3-deoxy-7-phosphoheptulonate synthase [Phycisphaerae bacterium]|nr:3-deoxy-7-phosphoheptulonate synthase [Phycisphaerae bacterium]
MNENASREQIDAVRRRIEEIGFSSVEMPDAARVSIGINGANGNVSVDEFLHLAGVDDCIPGPDGYKLVRRESRAAPTVIRLGDVSIGDGHLQIIAGPCAIESRDQVMRTAEIVARSGAKLFRGGAFKPRTSPYAFQGLKHEGLRLLEDMRDRFGLRIVTEVKDVETLEAVAAVADVLQIGARNMHNYSLLEACGRIQKPVLLKRGMGSTLKELFMAAEYVLALGNPDVILCERGIRTFETMTRNTFDVSAIPMIKRYTHLPVVADPSHGVGIDWAVSPMARAAVVAGADAVMVEVHPNPAEALSDGQQALTFAAYQKLTRELGELAAWREKNGN